jgi:ABC-type Fe2+-enterobactin transport system substrate-binding protein
MDTNELQTLTRRSAWRLKECGRPGTVREALALTSLKLRMAVNRHEQARKLEELAADVYSVPALCHIARAEKALRKDARKLAHEALWQGLRAQVLLAVGAPMA